jgi:DNA-binding HxlR family transcriptional regulator
MNKKLIFTRSVCPITNSLDLLGDKWTLLIVRDLVLGKKKYQEFLSSPEGIATNILADRLKRLQEAGIIVRKAYQHNPVRYEYVLTNKGGDLKSVLKILASWGLKNFPGTRIFPSVTTHE